MNGGKWLTHDRPWEPERARMAVRGHLVVRLRDDDLQPDLPAHVDVAAGVAEPARESGWHRLDRAVAKHSSFMRLSRAYHASGSLGRRGAHHLGYSPLERELGLSRTFRLAFDSDASVLHLVEALRALDGVEMATPVYLCHLPGGVFDGVGYGAGRSPAPPDPLYAHRMIHAAEALAEVPGDSALIVGVVDSGVALDHPELNGRLRRGSSTCHLTDEGAPRSLKLVPGATDRQPLDHMGHGTSCAGIIAARGLEIPPGLAGESMVLPIRALAASHIPGSTALSAVGRTDDIDLGVKLGIDLGARVLNLSFGTPASALREDDEVPHVDVVRYALSRDCVLCAASGNGGDDVAYYPAALPGVIAVGAVGASGRPSRFTSRGPHVALSAPGEAIPSAGLKGYDRVTGTSFASPFVAAACALLIARASAAGLPVTAFNVRSALIDGAAPFAPGIDGAGCGAGILDVTGALRALDSLLTDSADQEAESPATLAGARPGVFGRRPTPKTTTTPKTMTWAETRMEGG